MLVYWLNAAKHFNRCCRGQNDRGFCHHRPKLRHPAAGNLERILPEGAPFFSEDQVTDFYERDIAAELIREAALNHLRDEIPHGMAVRIDEFTERNTRRRLYSCHLAGRAGNAQGDCHWAQWGHAQTHWLLRPRRNRIDERTKSVSGIEGKGQRQLAQPTGRAALAGIYAR